MKLLAAILASVKIALLVVLAAAVIGVGVLAFFAWRIMRELNEMDFHDQVM